jgi:hypothetical protein
MTDDVRRVSALGVDQPVTKISWGTWRDSPNGTHYLVPVDRHVVVERGALMKMIGFILGYWPGYEDALHWDDDMRGENYGFYRAALDARQALTEIGGDDD